MLAPRVILLAALACASTAFGQKLANIGAGGCSAANCHGGTTAASEATSRIWGNEYALWAVPDKHSKAYKALQLDRSKRMGQILRIADVTASERCTSCHVVGSPAKNASDGVSCEGCHGPAEKWLGPHVQPNSHATSVSLGMTDLNDPVVRARQCMTCHIGTAERIVDHELIAAGHPDLAFELETFSWAQPLHYRDDKPAAGNRMPRVRLWAVGQAVGLAEGMRTLATRASRQWPEFAELECYQCHHDLKAESWRIARGYPNRKPGAPQVNLARNDIARILIAQAAPDQRAAVESSIENVANLVENRFTDGAGIAAAANRAAQQADALAARFAKQDFDANAARGLVRAIAGDINRIAGSGVHSAEQATMALDALLTSMSGDTTKAPAGIEELYKYLEHPSTYQPAQFVALYRKAAGGVATSAMR